MKHIFNNLSEESFSFLLLENKAVLFSISKIVGIITFFLIKDCFQKFINDKWPFYVKKFLDPFCFACTLGLLPCLCTSPQS